MKKILLSVAVATLFAANAYADFLQDSANGCYVDTKGTNTFWFCGKAPEKCSDKKVKGFHKKNYLYNGDYFDRNGTRYWCCGGSATAHGRFTTTSTSTPWSTSETATKSTAAGTCTYVKTTNVCGDVTGDCSVASDGSNAASESTLSDAQSCELQNKLWRNNVCVEYCVAPKAFASTSSNSCIDCETTNFQGISGDVCVKCDPGSQLFDKTSRRCVDKSYWPKYSRSAMETCYACTSNTLFQECVKLFSNRTNTMPENEILTGCKINSDSRRPSGI